MMMRVRSSLWLILSMLSLSLLLVVMGAYATTRTESLTVTGYTSGVILTLGSYLGLLGLLAVFRKQLLTAAIVFLSFGIISCFMCVVIDGVCIVLSMDMRPLKAERCQYYSSGTGYIYENFLASVSCWNLNESCNMTVRSGTCYCCDLYDCANGGYLSNYYEIVGVQSCGEVFTLYLLIWILAGLNLIAFFTGILQQCLAASRTRSSSPVTEPSESTVSSPTAPLLMDANTNQCHPGAFMYFPPGENTAAPSIPRSEFNPPPFSPLTSLLP